MKPGARVYWLLLITSTVCLFALSARTASNPIQIENALPGTTDWQLSNPAANHEIEGYASLASVNRGGQVSFFVNTTDPSYTLEIFRMGWYGGDGGRRMTNPITLTGVQQVVPAPDQATGLIDCNWIAPYTITTSDPTDSTKWLSGIYLVKLTGTSSGKQSYIIFVVREDSRASNILVQEPVATSQAYNAYGGKSLYNFNSTNSSHAVKVSFNRPYDTGWGTGNFLSYEFDGISFLEEQGDDVAYSTSPDTDQNASALSSHQVFLTVGHDEYWSWAARQNIENARDAGMSLGFMGANDIFWRIRWETSPATGAAERVVVCYKDDDLAADPDASIPADYNFVTTEWREGYITSPPLPEDAVMGEMYTDFEPASGPIVISGLSPSWAFANSALTVGSKLPGLLGYEVDEMFADSTTPANAQLVTQSPYTVNGATEFGDMVTYVAGSGATVFDFGTLQWVWGLSSISPPPWGPTPSLVNAGAQQITINVINQLVATGHAGATPTPSPSPSVSATPTSTGSITPTATPTASGAYQITNPSNGAVVAGTVSIAISTTLPAATDWWNDLAVDGVATGLTDAGHYLQITWNSNTVGNGTHTLTVRGHQENTGSITAISTVTVMVGNNAPTPTPTLTQTLTPTPTPVPSFQVSNPVAGATVSGAIAISVVTSLSLAQDWWNDLLVDGVGTGLSDAGHYQQINWNSATVANGAHTLTVRAHQETSNTVNAKASVSINVTN